MPLIFRGYTEAGKKRISELGQKLLLSHISRLPPITLIQIYKPLSVPKGFRPGAPAIKKQSELLVTRLRARRSNREIDYKALELVWRETSHFYSLEKYIDSYYDNLESSLDESDDDYDGLMEIADEVLVQSIVESRNISKEQFKEFLLISPIELNKELTVLISTLPSTEDLEKEKLLAELPEKIEVLEERESKLEEQLPAVIQVLENRIDLLVEKTTDLTKLGDEVLEFRDSVNSLTKLASESKAIESKIDIAKDEFGIEIESIRSSTQLETKALSKDIERLKDQITSVESNPPLSEERDIASQYAKHGNTYYPKKISNSAENDKPTISTENELIEYLENLLYEVGIRKSQFRYIVPIVLTCLTERLVLRLTGSLSRVISRSLVQISGHGAYSVKMNLGQPLGLELKFGELLEHGTIGGLLLENVSLAPPELAYPNLVSTIELMQRNEESMERLFIIATFSKGPIHLPFNNEFAQLGLELDLSNLLLKESNEFKDYKQITTQLLNDVRAGYQTEHIADVYSDFVRGGRRFKKAEHQQIMSCIKAFNYFTGIYVKESDHETVVLDLFVSSIFYPRFSVSNQFSSEIKSLVNELGIELKQENLTSILLDTNSDD